MSCSIGKSSITFPLATEVENRRSTKIFWCQQYSEYCQQIFWSTIRFQNIPVYWLVSTIRFLRPLQLDWASECTSMSAGLISHLPPLNKPFIWQKQEGETLPELGLILVVYQWLTQASNLAQASLAARHLWEIHFFWNIYLCQACPS